MKHLRTFLISFLIPVVLITALVWLARDEKTVYVTEIINKVPDTKYCYTSEDGDWLICRLE